MTTDDHVNERALAALRIAIGVFFCVYGMDKVSGAEFTLHGGFQDGVRSFLTSGSAFPFIRPVLAGILAHCATPIAFLVAYGELAIDLSLIAGLLSRVASIFGLVLMLLLWFSGGYPGAHAPFWSYLAASENWTIFALCFLAFIFGHTENVWSVKLLKKALGKS
jgi:thiosulfate dehydrogenase [quinone] large subunit